MKRHKPFGGLVSVAVRYHFRGQLLRRRRLPRRHLGVHQGDLPRNVLLLGDVAQDISEASSGRHVGTESERVKFCRKS